MKRIALVAVAMTVGSSASLFGAQKRYLGAGWDFGALPVVDMVQSLDELAKTPLDGIRFSFKAEMADGTKVSLFPMETGSARPARDS